MKEKVFVSGFQRQIHHKEWIERLLAMTKAMRRRDLSIYLGSESSLAQSFDPLGLKDIEEIKHMYNKRELTGRVYYQAVDHFIRSEVEPFQAILNNWMLGARATVNATKVPFTEVITWCQETSDNQARRALAREVHAICSFLAPFSYVSWKALLNVVENILGYSEYIAFCEKKRGISIRESNYLAQNFLQETRDIYRNLIGPWLKEVTMISLKDASRFDAIYLLGLRYLDHLFPQWLTIDKIMDFFRKWEIDLGKNPALHIHSEGARGRQSYCVPVDIPGEVHVIVGPLSGWLDMESLFHELGHALSFIYTDPALSSETKNFYQSGALSETFAFLFQRMCMSKEFLRDVLGLSSVDAKIVSRAHALKWLTLIRRYSAKLIIEVENFHFHRLREGKSLYSEIMERETGFYYDPETYLFDLMPDFYSLDYFEAFLGSACLWEYLNENIGDDWILNPETGIILNNWWRKGNIFNLSEFLQNILNRPLESDPFIKKNKYDFQN
jgi:hypothetical protein